MKPDAALITDMDWASASEIAEAVSSRRISAIEVINGALSRIAARDAKLNSFTDVVAARARATASKIDQAIADGGQVGPLAGVPFAVKNLFDIEGLPTRAGSKINRDRAPQAVMRH